MKQLGNGFISAEILNNLGTAYLCLDDQEGLQYIKRAMLMNPSLEKINLSLGCGLKKL